MLVNSLWDTQYVEGCYDYICNKMLERMVDPKYVEESDKVFISIEYLHITFIL